nr:MAG TPA: hypothetical protein [Caudoviricetes sp.]
MITSIFIVSHFMLIVCCNLSNLYFFLKVLKILHFIVSLKSILSRFYF